MCILLASEGFLLLRPGGALVHAAQRNDDPVAEAADRWWRESPVHMGCSIATCTRLAKRLATYRQVAPRGATWRAYGFCELHEPPADAAGLVYRLGRPRTAGYDVPLTPLWAQVYFLLAAFGFGVWCTGNWKYAGRVRPATRWIPFGVLHAAAIFVLFRF
ncbi:MAG: hypothetical protein C5B51_28400 [Terriglobia bacterium]|nr:MAG: hypothetical protein C5B51_28400 [Terriglobia bacterium]